MDENPKEDEMKIYRNSREGGRSTFAVNPAFKFFSKLLTVFGMVMMFAVSGVGASFKIADVTENEGNSARTMTFTVTIDSPCRRNVTYTVDWTTANNTAIAGEDYTASNGTITYTQGNTSINSGTCGTRTVTVPILGDTVVESNENFYINLSKATTSNTSYPANISDNQASGTLNNDDGINLYLTNTDSADPIFTNRTVTYALRVTNSGPQNASNLVLTDSVSNGTITAVSGDGWNCTHTVTTATCTKSSLNTGVTSNMVNVSVLAPSLTGTITNSASVSAIEIDSYPNNNTNIIQTTEVRELIEATTQDICYSGITYSGMMCMDFGLFKGGIGCRQTIPLKNISGSALSSVNSVIDVSGMSGSIFSDCGIDGTSGNCEQQNSIDFGPMGIFSKGISYSMPNFSIDASHSIYETSLMSMAIFSGTNLYATYEKNGAYYSSQINQCPVQIGWEQLEYETSENTALTYGDSSQMPMKITIDHAVDYPISVSFATSNGSAIGDSDYRISHGSVTIPAGETSVTINMDIYHDEAIELTENFYVTLTNPTGSGGVTLKSGYDIATVRIMEQNTAPMCYSDNFDGTLDDKWRTLYSNGTFIPQINSGHLKLTPGKKNIATAVTKDYEFPSAENLIIIEFQHYAYGGCFEESPPQAGLGTYGADRIVAVLYDSAVGATPTPGGYGGSMGYAQNTAANPQKPGFQGGWLGLGLDEYGNFANPTEGRVGGPGFHTNAAVIRGDGSGTSGYEFLAEAYPLATPIAPVVDYTNPPKLPGDKFRMTVDARDTAHLYIRLERDTGSGYVTIINNFDAKNPIYNQTTTPEMVRFALTAGTGGGCNAHEIDELTVWGRCQPYNPSTDIPTAVGFDARETSIPMTDNNRSITTKISDKPFQLNIVSLDDNGALASYAGVNYNRVYLFPENNTTCSLSPSDRLLAIATKPRDWYVTFNQDDENKITPTKTISNASKDKRILMNFMDWNQAFQDANFNCSNSNSQAVLKGVPQCLNSNTKIGTVFPTLVTECLGGLRPACESNSYASSGLPSAPYNNDYGCYQCLAGGAGTTVCSSDNFAIRPERLVINSTNTHMPNLLRSAQDYNVSINAYNFNSTTNTLDYNVTDANSTFFVSTTKYMKNSEVNASMAGSAIFASTAFDMSNGVSVKSGIAGNEVAGLAFDDVGKISISVQDRTWAAVDHDDTPLTCDQNGSYICGDKNVTFIPHHFDFSDLNITNNNGSTTSFTYIANELDQMAGRIQTTMRALNANDGVTQNFSPFPLWENNVTVVPIVQSTFAYTGSNAILHDANVTMINNQMIGFSNGAKTITWDESNTSQYLRFNFQRFTNQTIEPFDVNGTELNITLTSQYIDPEDGDIADIYGDRNATGDGTADFVYGRIIPRDVRVFGNVAFTANAWYEVFNAPTLIGTTLPESRNTRLWYVNTLHDDQNYGDGNVTRLQSSVGSTLENIGGDDVNGMETYNFGAVGAANIPYSRKAHIDTAPWLWYGQNALDYLDPSAANLNCFTHPCFNINVVPDIGRAGSATSTEMQGEKANKGTSSGTGVQYDYTPATR